MHEPEDGMLEHIIDTIKITERSGEVDDKLKRIGKHAYTYRHLRTLWILHYSFHAYVNMLLHKFKEKTHLGNCKKYTVLRLCSKRYLTALGVGVADDCSMVIK